MTAHRTYKGLKHHTEKTGRRGERRESGLDGYLPICLPSLGGQGSDLGTCMLGERHGAGMMEDVHREWMSRKQEDASVSVYV